MTSYTNLPLWPTDDDLEELDNLFDEVTKEIEVTVPDISWREAYEANKTRDTCILCGQKTRITSLLSTNINTCPCVDELAKKDNKHE